MYPGTPAKLIDQHYDSIYGQRNNKHKKQIIWEVKEEAQEDEFGEYFNNLLNPKKEAS